MALQHSETHPADQRDNRDLLMLIRCNEVVARATTEQELFQNICQGMVETGGYRMCWVGLAEHDERKSVRPVAFAGHEAGYLKTINLTWSDAPSGRGPTGTAIRTGKPVVGIDFETDPRLAPWKEAALQRGYRSSTALPLIHEGRQLGVITLYSSTLATFDDAELERLSRLCSNIAYGVNALRTSLERRRSELQRERLATAIEQAAEAVMITDLQGTLEYVNPAFEAVTGYCRAEVLGQNPRLLKSGTQPPEFYRQLWETIRAGKTWRGRVVNKRKDGQLFTGDASIAPVRDSSGAITAYVAVEHDMTRALELEAQFLQSQKMEGIGRLAAGVAHDFNNVLSIILSLTDIAQHSVTAENPLKADLEEIAQAAHRAAALTRQLLAFSRKQVLQPVALDLNAVIAGVERMLTRLVGEDIALEKVLAPELGVITADPGQVEQVLMNLVINARDAMPDGGVLKVETRNVERSADYAALHPGVGAGPYVMVRVSDSGTGMSAYTLAHLFEPFFTTKAVGKGTGLGLSTVHRIVEQSGGHLEVFSKLGEGTTFEICFPRERSVGAQALASPLPHPVPTGSETVLVVEDEDSVRSLVRRILEGAGYTVLTAANGAEAVQRSDEATAPIQLAVCDVMLPRLSGDAVVERLQQLHPKLKALFLSGYTDETLAQHRVLGPGVHFLPKPFSPAELLRKVRRALDG